MQHVYRALLTLGEERTLHRIDGGVSMVDFLAAADVERLKTMGLVDEVDRLVFITQLGRSCLTSNNPRHTKLFFGGSPEIARNNYEVWRDQQKAIQLIYGPVVFQAGPGWGVEIHYIPEEAPWEVSNSKLGPGARKCSVA